MPRPMQYRPLKFRRHRYGSLMQRARLPTCWLALRAPLKARRQFRRSLQHQAHLARVARAGGQLNLTRADHKRRKKQMPHARLNDPTRHQTMMLGLALRALSTVAAMRSPTTSFSSASPPRC